MKRIGLLLLTVLSMPAFVPPPQPAKSKKLPTFGQIIHDGQERRQKAIALLPADLRREILRINTKIGPVLNIPAMAREILNHAGINKVFRMAVNKPQNMLIILQSLPKAGAVYLAQKLERMPGIQSKEVQEWWKSITLENGEDLFEAVTAENPDSQIIENILENPNIDVNWKDSSGYNSLMRASTDGDAEIVKHLITAGANVNAKNRGGETALMYAAITEHAEIIKILVAAGANINLKNDFGNTALMEASESGYAQIVRILLEAGADPSIQNRAGDSAQSLAYYMMYKIPEKRAEYAELRKLLRDAEKAQQEKATRK
jgi:hypothetical protein